MSRNTKSAYISLLRLINLKRQRDERLAFESVDQRLEDLGSKSALARSLIVVLDRF